MSPGLKREYTMHKFRANQFETVDGLTDRLSVALPCGFTQLGYIEPGHGKQQWIYEDADLEEMYSKYKKNDVLLWCLKKLDD